MRLLLLSALLPALCSTGAFASSEDHAEPSAPEAQAEFLAGLPLPKQSVLARLQNSPEYRQHQKELQDQWAFCRKIRYEAMQQWGIEHLGRYPATRGVLRYLFGGPDFLNAHAFFPDSRVMVLGGLEPVGDVPPPEALDPAALGTALRSLDAALHTSLFCGYFITSEMKPQLARGSFQGVLPVLYTELALTGNTILAVRAVRPFGAPGVQIIYRRPGGQDQTLYYFKADLSDGNDCGNFLSWLADLGPGCSYLKAASYLLPLPSFSETRNFLLKTSSLILQDDSGIPFRDFLPGAWKIRLFGVYTEPLPIFRLHRESELESAYTSSDYEGPLPFGAGYHVNANGANLLLAIRNNGSPETEVREVATPAQRVITVPQVIAAATPTPTPVMIRKALPVPIRKAIPVGTPLPKHNRVPVIDTPPVFIPLSAPGPIPEASAIHAPQATTGHPLLPVSSSDSPSPAGSEASPREPTPSPVENPNQPAAENTGEPVGTQTLQPADMPATSSSLQSEKETSVPLTKGGKPVD